MQSTIKTISEKSKLYKSLFEYNYYKYIRVYDKVTVSKINFASTVVVSFLLGGLSLTILTLWKPIHQWSFIEIGAITYLFIHTGLKISEHILEYLTKVSKGLLDLPPPHKYKFKPLKPVKISEGDSYLNPIDLTQEMAEEREAIDALLMLNKKENKLKEQ